MHGQMEVYLIPPLLHDGGHNVGKAVRITRKVFERVHAFCQDTQIKTFSSAECYLLFYNMTKSDLYSYREMDCIVVVHFVLESHNLVFHIHMLSHEVAQALNNLI